jgi:hypothetical protein
MRKPTLYLELRSGRGLTLAQTARDGAGAGAPVSVSPLNIRKESLFHVVPGGITAYVPDQTRFFQKSSPSIVAREGPKQDPKAEPL